MKKGLYKIIIVCLLAIIIINTSCQKLDPISVTMFNNDKTNVNPGSYSASVSYMFADIGDEITSYGICISKDILPTINDLTIAYLGKPKKQITITSQLTNLLPETQYHARAYAISGEKTIYSDDIDFKTITSTVKVTTNAISDISNTTSTSGGAVTADASTTITARGICWSSNPNPTIALSTKTSDSSGIGTFISRMKGLTANKTYYVRAYIITSNVIVYAGNEISFTTLTAPAPVTDIDGNIYHTITIGTQVWMVENLRTTKYNDGSSILNITDNTAWTVAGAAYCWYNNDVANKAKYGALYNWNTFDRESNGNKNICPTGWHLPTDAELTTLITYLGGESSAGGKMKETGIAHWVSPNTGADNISGFTALPGGYRNGSDGTFNFLGSYGILWGSTKRDASTVWNFSLGFDYANANHSWAIKQYGFSVRCIHD